MATNKRLPRGVTEEDLAHAKLRAACRRARAAELADWDGQFAMLKHPGFTRSQALEAERAASEAVLEAGLSGDELIRHRAKRLAREAEERATARRRAAIARERAEYAAGVMERAERNRSYTSPFRAAFFITLLLIILVAPYWGK